MLWAGVELYIEGSLLNPGTVSLLPGEFLSRNLSWLLDMHVEGVSKQA